MLPTETFADAVAFLRLFDLGALAVASALYSTLAVKASSAIRWEEFPGLGLYFMDDDWIDIRRAICPNDAESRPVIARLTFPSEDKMAQFVTAAFPNCIFEDVVVCAYLSEQVADTIGRVANSVIIKGVFRPPNMSHDNTVNLVRKFPQVKVT